MTSVWSGEDSYEIQEEDDNNVSQIVFIGSLIYNDNLAIRKIIESIVIEFIENSVMTDAKHYSTKTDSDNGAKFEIDEEA